MILIQDIGQKFSDIRQQIIFVNFQLGCSSSTWCINLHKLEDWSEVIAEKSSISSFDYPFFHLQINVLFLIKPEF